MFSSIIILASKPLVYGISPFLASPECYFVCFLAIVFKFSARNHIFYVLYQYDCWISDSLSIMLSTRLAFSSYRAEKTVVLYTPPAITQVSAVFTTLSVD